MVGDVLPVNGFKFMYKFKFELYDEGPKVGWLPKGNANK